LAQDVSPLTLKAPIRPASFGGRQSARTVHFITAGLIVLFVFVHVAMLILAGPLNELRSMITGKFVISLEDNHE
jgi:thiosulfate reductase cytochrome b subunit